MQLSLPWVYPRGPSAAPLGARASTGRPYIQLSMQVGGSIGLFSLMTMVSFLLLAPVALLIEGPVFLPSRVAAMGVQDPQALFKSATIAAATFHLYQQVSYMILARVSPVTHSIGNCVKRCAPLHHLLPTGRPHRQSAAPQCGSLSRAG